MSKVQADIGRQGIVVAAVAVLVAALAYLGYGYWQSHSAKPSDLATVRVTHRGAPSKESDHYQQVLQRYNDTNADAAARDGQTYLSVPSTRAVNVKPAVIEEAPASSPSATPQAVPVQAPLPAPVQRAATAPQDPEHGKFLEEQVQGLMSNWTAPPPGLATVSKDAKDYAASLAPATPPSTQATAKGSGSNAPGLVIVPGYALAPALLRTNVDTDESSVTEAYIPAGPYAGAQLFAPSYKRAGDSAIVIHVEAFLLQAAEAQVSCAATDRSVQLQLPTVARPYAVYLRRIGP